MEVANTLAYYDQWRKKFYSLPFPGTDEHKFNLTLIRQEAFEKFALWNSKYFFFK